MALTLSSLPDLRPDDVELRDLRAGVDGLQRPVEAGADLGGRGLLGIGRQADGDVARGAEDLHLRIVEAGARRARVRTSSTLTARGKLTSAFTPPVKSMARFRPRVKNETSDTIISTADSVYHTLRVAMNGKLVCVTEEFHVRSSQPAGAAAFRSTGARSCGARRTSG